MAPKLLASSCSLACTSPRQNGSVFIGTFLYSRQLYGGVLEMRLLAHRIPPGDRQLVGRAVGAIFVPITKMKWEEHMARFNISNARPSLDFASPRGHLHNVPFGNALLLGVRFGNLHKHFGSCRIQLRHSASLRPRMPMIHHAPSS